MVETHEEVVVLYTMAKQVDGMHDGYDGFATLMKEVAGCLKTVLVNQKAILDNQNAMKKELFVLSNSQAEVSPSEQNQTRSQPRVSVPRSPQSSSHGCQTSAPSYSAKAAATSSVPPTPSSQGPPLPPPQRPTPQPQKTATQKSMKTKYQSKPKILYVSDSVGRNVDFPKIEKEVKCTIRTTKAYSSALDMKALWPRSNFTDVVRDDLAKVPANVLVMSAPTVDITNIDTTKIKQSENTDVYQKMVHVSCVNMVACAENALKENPDLKKVIIMEHAP